MFPYIYWSFESFSGLPFSFPLLILIFIIFISFFLKKTLYVEDIWLFWHVNETLSLFFVSWALCIFNVFSIKQFLICCNEPSSMFSLWHLVSWHLQETSSKIFRKHFLQSFITCFFHLSLFSLCGIYFRVKCELFYITKQTLFTSQIFLISLFLIHISEWKSKSESSFKHGASPHS